MDHYTSHGDDGVIVGWVQPTGLTPFAVGCTHPTNGSPVPACGIRSIKKVAFFSLGLIRWEKRKSTGETQIRENLTEQEPEFHSRILQPTRPPATAAGSGSRGQFFEGFFLEVAQRTAGAPRIGKASPATLPESILRWTGAAVDGLSGDNLLMSPESQSSNSTTPVCNL